MDALFSWNGNKVKKPTIIKKFFPETFDTYYEPFLGSGTMFFKLNPKRAIIGDIYKDIMNFFFVLKKEPKRMIEKINSLSDEYQNEISKMTTKKQHRKKQHRKIGEKFYYFFRENNFDDPFDRAIQFYVLRHLSYFSMVRFNSSGKSSVPFGWRTELNKINATEEEINSRFERTILLIQDWKETVKTSTKNDLVFLDPPYMERNKKFHPDEFFREKEHYEIKDWFSSFQTRAIIILEKDEFTSSLYNKFIKEEYDVKSKKSIKNQKNAVIKYILATNF